MHTVQKKQEAIRLRNDERRSLGEIARILGLNKSTVYYWLNHVPLTKDELASVLKKRGKKFSEAATQRRLANESKFHKMVASEQLSRQRKCRIAEAATLYRLALLNFEVFGTPFEGDVADWIVVTPDRHCLRIQVKWLFRAKQGMPQLPLTHSAFTGKRLRYEEEVDAFVGYDLYTDVAYVYLAEEVRDLKRVKSVTADAAERWDKLVMKTKWTSHLPVTQE